MRKSLFLLLAFLMLKSFNAQVVTIGEGTKDDSYLPVAPFFKYSYSQNIYLASEINQSGYIYRIKYKGKPGIDISNSNDWTVYIGHTTQNSVTSGGWIPVSEMTQVFSGAISVINDNVQITFTAPFNYNGTDNLVIAVDENQDGYDASSNRFLASDVANDRSLLFRHDNYNPDPSSPPATSIVQKAVANIDLDFNENICNTPTSLSASNLTESSADLSWTAGGTETQWIVKYGTSGFTQGSGTTVNTTSNPYSLTGLESGTTYDFYVKADCGSIGQSEWNGPYTFLTTCSPFNLPFFEGFESGYSQDVDIASCITQQSVLGNNSWRANTSIVSFNRAPRTGSWNAYLRYNNEDWLFIPVQLIAGKSYTAELYARQNGKTGAQIAVSYGQNNTAADMTNSIVGETEIIDGDYQKVIGEFTPTTTGAYYVGIKGKLNSSPYYLSIDDIRVRETPTCLTPEALTTNNITTNTADLGWTAKGSETAWIIEYGESGFAHGSGTTVNTTTNPHTISGLSPNTKYDFYVKADCGTDNQSDWSGVHSFTTTCAPYTIPYFEGFEAGYVQNNDIANCISQESVSGNLGWRANNVYKNYNRTPRTGEWNAYLSNQNEDWFFIPVQFTAGKSYTIDLYARQDKTAGAEISISYGNTNTAVGMTNEILPETNITNGDYQKILANFTIAETGNYYLGIKGKLSDVPMYLSIDDIRIREMPTCVEPSQLKVNNITSTSADLSWTAGGNESAWIVEYGETGFAQGSGNVVNVSSNPYSLTGLAENTKYEFYVKADCEGTNGQSEWTGPYKFSTTCTPFTIPYFEGFETGYTHDEEIAACITQESVSGNTAWDANDTHVNYNRTPRTGSWNATLRFSNEDWMFILVNLEGGASYNVQLYARQDEKTGAQIAVSYGTEGTAAAMTNSIVAETELVDGNYQEIKGSFTPTASGAYFIGIKGKLDYTPYYISLDDISITKEASCTAPTDLSAVNITTSTAELSWTAGGSETAWIVEYGESGFTQGSGTTVNTTTNPHKITGLTENSTYDFYVKADCSATNSQSDWAGPYTFTVTCSAFTPTYVESFEYGYTHDNNIAGCITQESVSGGLGWRANNSHTNYNRSPRTGNWNINLPYNNEDWFFIPFQLTGGKSYTIDLYTRQDGISGASIAVSYGSTNTAAGMTNVIVAETDIINGGYQKIIGNLTPETTGVYYIGIKGKLNFTPYYLSVDDIRLRETPTCVEPSGLSASNVTDTSADLSWTAGGSETAWIVEYGEEGFTQGSGTTVNVTTNSYSLTGLTVNTTYQFYVKADCGTTDGQSEWTGPYTFKTFCVPYTVPYFEGFETGYTHNTNVGGCITQEGIDSYNAWKANNTFTDFNRTPRTGEWNAFLKFNNEEWMYIPVQLTAGKSYTVELYARQDKSSGAQITVSYGSSSSVTAMTNSIVAETEITNGEYQKLSGNFTPAESGAYFIGIKGKLNYTPFYMSVDDISIKETASCVAPTGLAATNATSTSVDLSWTAGGSETAWILEYGEEGFTQGSGTTVNVTTNSYSLTGLTVNTTYQFYVKADCGTTDGQSEWSESLTFSTTLSTAEVNSDKELTYYPNPVKDYLHINAESTIENVKIFNSNGQLVFDKNTNSATIEVNTSKLSSGVYIVRATLGDKEKVFKVLKK